MMPSFLSEGSPLSAVTSVVNKFGLFDSKAETSARAPEKGERREVPESAGVRSSQEIPATSAPRTAPEASAPRTAPLASLCPVCARTELQSQTPGQNNWNRCTQCQLLVCSQCGFNPNPHITQVREWLCLNCQMQRALGMDMTSAPGTKPQPLQSKGTPPSASPVAKQGSAQPTAQQKEPTQRAEQMKPLSQAGPRKQPLLTKQKSMAASPPQKLKQPLHGPPEHEASQKTVQQPKLVKPSPQDSTTQVAERKQASPSSQQKGFKGTPKMDQIVVQQSAEKLKDSDLRTQQHLKMKRNSSRENEAVQKVHVVDASPSPLAQKPALKIESKTTHPKEEQVKPGQQLLAAKPETSQIPPESQKVQKPPEQSRRFSLNLGGSTTQPPQFQPTTPQESVTGKLFGFGASLFSQASTLISTAPQPQQQHKAGTKQHPAQPTPTASAMPAKNLKLDAGKREIKPQAAEKLEQEVQGTKETGPSEKDAAGKQITQVPAQVPKPTEPELAVPSETTCPLCKTDLNIGSKAAPNYNTCTECKTVVCILCGFNPMPHLPVVEEWLCLTCHTQRVLSGQLGESGKMSSMLPMSVKQSSPMVPPPEQQHSQQDSSSVCSASSKTLSGQAMVLQPKETEQKQASLSQEKEVKKAVSNIPAKPEEISAAIKQDVSQFQDPRTPKPGTGEQLSVSEKKQLQSISKKTEAAKKPVTDVPMPMHLETAVKDPAAETEKVITEKEEDKSDSAALLQQRSPQGLSDTGYSSDGISSSLGEITTTLQSEDKDLLKEPTKNDSISQESSPSSPSDLAKLESTVLSILEAQANTQNNEKPGQYKDPYRLYTDQEREQHRPRTLSITPESYSSDEEDLEDIQEEDEEGLEDENHIDMLHKTEARESCGSQDEAAVRRQRYDSLEDSSESELSPRPHRQRAISVGFSSSDSHGSGDEEEFIRKQIIEMSAEESGSDEDEYIRGQLKEISTKERSESKGSTVKHKRLSKKSSLSHDDESGRRHSWHDEDEDDESPDTKYRETKSQDNDLSLSAGGGLRRFKTIDLNSSITNKYAEGSENKKDELYYDEEPELEMESLTDSPEDRSRGEGSSSLHATSSLTPGTSPTSASSLDEDSDSGPSHHKVLSESKQQRKARHRSHGPLLPTIEDSSEEEELREEEELLREQEKQREWEQQQRKSSTKKSKKDKDELRAQRRRERPKTPPSNLSPIEDASPTEELRQAAEMEELHRSSCSEYSPSVESESEGFEISPEKIIVVQKVYKLPMSVSLYSPTDDKSANAKSLKSAEEAYEALMQKARLLQNKKGPDEVFEKEPLYGGMLIEDYIYESLVEDAYNESTDNHDFNTGQDTGAELFQGAENKLRTPDEIYEEIMKKSPSSTNAHTRPLEVSLQQQQLISTTQTRGNAAVPHSLAGTEPCTDMDRHLLDADTTYEELMKRQRALLTPGTSPTQPSSPESPVSAGSDATRVSVTTFSSASTTARDQLITSMPRFDAEATQMALTGGRMHSIPDVKITQHFTVEEDIETELAEQYGVDKRHDVPKTVKHKKPETTACSLQTTTATCTECVTSTCTIPSTVPAAETAAVCYTAPTRGNISTTSKDTVISSSPSTVIDPVTCAMGGTSQGYPISVTAPSELATMPDHRVISVPPSLDSSDLASSAIVASSVVNNLYGKVSPSVSVTRCGTPSVSQPRFKFAQASILPGSEKRKITSTTDFTTATCSAPQPAQTTSWNPSIPFKVGSFVTSPALQSDIDSELPPPPPPPPLPPLTFQNPVIIPKKSAQVQVPASAILHPMPPPVPPKPASIPSGLIFPTRPIDGLQPAMPPKPTLTHHPLTVHRSSELQHKASTLSLNLTSPGDFKPISPTSPMSPLSNRSSPKLTLHSQATYVVITLPSEPGTPTESITCQASPTQLEATSSKSHGFACLPSTISLAHFTQSLETQKIVERGKTETVYFYQSLAHGVISTVAHEPSTHVTKVPVVYNTVPSTGALSVSISIPPDSKYSQQPHLHQTRRALDHTTPFLSDVIDLRTLSSLDTVMADQGMDLSTLSMEGRRQDLIVDAGGRCQGSVVQPAIVNLSTAGSVDQMPCSTLAVPTVSVTAVACTSDTTLTAASERPVDLGHDVPLPLQLTAKFDDGAVPRGQTAEPSVAEVPINLTCGTTIPAVGWSEPSSIAPTGTTNGWIDGQPAEVVAVDLSTRKPHRMMVALDDLTSGIATGIVDEEDKPVDLTAGRQSVCCDVVYKFPFGRSCSSLAKEPASALPEDRYGYRDDHYVYDRNGSHGSRGFGSMKPSMSDTNLAEAGVFLYKSKHSFDTIGAAADGAVDLTAGKLTAGELVNYSTVCTQPQDQLCKEALVYPVSGQPIGATEAAGLSRYSQARIVPTLGSYYGVPSILRSSGGVVYSSVATPIPSTFPITTQPGSIFSHSLGLHTSETAPSISELPHRKTTRDLGVGFASGSDTSTFQSVGTDPLQSGSHTATTAEMYQDSSRGFMQAETDFIQKHDIDSPAVPNLSPIVSPESEENKLLLMEREMLEFEKMKQIRFAEELERERHEIQIFREQEKLIVQRELQELQTMKQQLLYQQEEERQAQFMIQQETIVQQQMQLEQIQQLQHQLQQQLEDQKIRQVYQYSYEPSGMSVAQTAADQAHRVPQYTSAENGHFWHSHDGATSVSAMMGLDVPQTQSWYAIHSDGIPQHIPQPCLPSSLSEISLKDVDVKDGRPLKKRSSMPRLRSHGTADPEDNMQESKSYKKIVDSGVQTDDEEGTERPYTSRRRRSKKSVDSSVQTDDEDNQEDWDIPMRRRKSRVGKYAGDGAELDKAKRLHFAKLSNIAVQTVSEISVQTEPEGIIRTPVIRAQIESKIEIVKHISAPEKTYKGESLGCQTEADPNGQSPPYLSTASPQQSEKKRPTPLEIGYSNHLRADSSFQVVPSPPKSPKVLYSPISPMSPNKELEAVFEPYEKTSSVDIISQKLTAPGSPKSQPLSPRATKVMQRSMSDPKPLSPTAEESSRLHFQYSDNYMTKNSQSIIPLGTQKKVKRTLPNPPPEEAGAAGSQAVFSSVSSVSRRRVCRTNTMARAKILQDIDRELELVERESSKLRKKQAELDEEEKEIDAKLRYLEMGINRRKEALLKEREKRERAYLQGVAEERDYMSDSEVSNIRETRMDEHGLERPRTAPQPDYDQFISSQTQSQAQYATTPSHYTQYQFSSSTPKHTQAQYHQQMTPFQTQPTYQAVPTITYQEQQSPASQGHSTAYPHTSQVVMIQQKPRQTAIVDLESKITTNYEVIHNQPVRMASTSTDTTYAVPHLSDKYSNLDLRLGLDERATMASRPISSISADSYYTDLEHHTPRNYVLIDDIGELTKGSTSLAPGFSLHNIQKEVQKSEHLLRASEARRAGDVKDYIGTLQTSSRLNSYGKAEEDSMEDPYELKLLKQQIKQEFRRGTEGLEHLSSLPHYYQGDSSYRHFAKSEKYSISRLTLEKQAAKQLPPSFLYQKQSKHKMQLLDPKISKILPTRDVEAEYASYLGSMPSAIGVSSRARLIQDDLTFGLRKNIRDQQKFLGPAIRSTLDDEIDKAYTSGTRSRPTSVYGLDLSIKRDPASTSLRIKNQENYPFDTAYAHSTPARTKPSSLPLSHSRGRIPIVAQNSEEESPLSPVGQPMGMARAAAGPLPPISADTREQFGSSHSLPEVQQHMREESRTRGYDRDIAFIMDDFQHAMSDSEAYHLRREETDWFDKPRESRLEDVRKIPENLAHSRQSQPQSAEISGKPIQYNFPYSRVRVQRDAKDLTISGNGLGIRIIGGKEIPGRDGEIGAYIAKVVPGGTAEQTGKLTEGMQVLEWNGIPLTGKTYEEVQCIIGSPVREAEICVRLDFNMLSDSEKLQHLDLKERTKPGEKQRSPGVDPKQLAAELQKVSQQVPCVVSSATEKGIHSHSGTTSAASSAAPSPGQPASPSVSKKRHSSKPPETSSKSHPVTGEIQLQMNYDKQVGNLIVHVLQARDLAPRENNGYSDPFVKVYLLPGRSVENKRRTKHVPKSLNPEWNQTVIYKSISMEQLKKKTLEVTVWDYDRISSNDFLGEVLIDLSSSSHFDNTLRWYQLKEQTESIDHVRSHSGQSSQQLPKTSVIKSHSHGIFPDPSKEMHMPTIEKSQSSPASSKSSSEGHLRSHGPSRSQSKSSVTQTHLEDAGAAIAAAEAAVQQLRIQPTHKSGQAQNHARKHRHSIAGVPIQRTQSDNLPSPANENKDQNQLAIRKVMSEGSSKTEGAKSTNQRPTESSISTASSLSSPGSGYNIDSEGSTTAGECNMFTDIEMCKMSQDTEIIVKDAKHKISEPFKQQGLGAAETDGQTQVMGEIKIALKKEVKTDGEQLLVEILQCRNITYKFKSPDHLPDLYVKLYVINLSTQKRVFKKKTRVCRHDREPSFNETFRFSLSPAGHSLQILLVSNGGKFMRKTLIGEAYIWLDQVDLRKRVVNWHKLLISSTESQRGAPSGFNVQI